MNQLYRYSIAISMLLITFYGCNGKDGVSGQDGIDGQDGRAAIAYSWMGDIYNVYSTDTTIPSTFQNEMYYYYASVGTYSYSYDSDYASWSGYYTIYIEEGTEGTEGTAGEKGGLFFQDGSDGEDGIDGDDGDDMCFELYMYSIIGPSFYEWYCDYHGVNLPRSIKNLNEDTYNRYIFDLDQEMNYYKNDFIPLKQLQKITTNSNISINEIDNNPNTIVQTGRIGKYHFIHKYMKVN